MNKQRILLLIVGLAALLLTQYKLIMPFIYKVAASDLFLVESSDIASQLPISTTLSDIAFMQCNSYIKSKIGTDVEISFPEKPLNAWSLGNYQFLISAEFNITGDSANSGQKKYACRINYDKGANQDGALDFGNWTVIGLTGLDD
jgi:hypothetical protein